LALLLQDEENKSQSEEPTPEQLDEPVQEAVIEEPEISPEAAEQPAAKDEATDGGETAGETSEEERPVTATLRRTSGIDCLIVDFREVTKANVRRNPWEGCLVLYSTSCFRILSLHKLTHKVDYCILCAIFFLHDLEEKQ
jgi:hypothetical protein